MLGSLQSTYRHSGMQLCNFIKKRLQHRGLPVEIAKFYRTPPVAAIVSLIK